MRSTLQYSIKKEKTNDNTYNQNLPNIDQILKKKKKKKKKKNDTKTLAK